MADTLKKKIKENVLRNFWYSFIPEDVILIFFTCSAKTRYFHNPLLITLHKFRLLESFLHRFLWNYYLFRLISYLQNYIQLVLEVNWTQLN